MKRWLYVWGPPVLGFLVVTGGVTAAVALGLAHCWVAVVPAIGVSCIAFFWSITDLASDGDVRRAKKLKAQPCEFCVVIGRILAVVTKDRDELREAILVLEPVSEPRDGGK